jgi:hypothetical protein
MFIGAVPRPVVTQLLKAAQFAAWKEIYVCCSGSFRVDRALKTAHPLKVVRGNDVSLISCAIGAALTGREFPLKFIGRLEFIESEHELATFQDRVAALMVAMELSRFSGKNEYSREHFQHIRAGFHAYLAAAKEKLIKITTGFPLDDYYGGDFRDHAQRAVENGCGIAGFMPTYKNGYERIYRFVNEATEWPAPSYRLWDPKDLPEWLAGVRASGTPYCVITDHMLDGLTPSTEFRSTTNKPVYGYVNEGGSSFRRQRNRAASFAYKPAEPMALTPKSTVELVPASSAQMTFLRNIYLAKGIAHANGVANWLVHLDGKLAGGFIYTRDRFDPAHDLYLLSDFCIVHERRMAKLIAMLALAHEPYDAWCKRFIVRPKRIRTTAFTDAPVSMKYRGIYELTSRKENPGRLEYQAQFQGRTAADLYLEWFGKYAQRPENEDRARQAGEPKAAREKRPLHGRARVQSPGREHQA